MEMKNELKKTISQLCGEVGTASAAARQEGLTEELEQEYDRRVRAGMAEIDAYRDVLKNIDAIREMLESLPETDEETKRAEREEGRKNLERILEKISTCMWLCTVIAFVLLGFRFGWRYSWLVFLWSSMGQTLLDMVKRVNRGKPLEKVMKDGRDSVFWIAVTIVYFLVSIASCAWHISWLVFLGGAVIQTFLSIFFK